MKQHGATFIKWKPNDTQKEADKKQTNLKYLNSSVQGRSSRYKILKTSDH